MIKTIDNAKLISLFWIVHFSCLLIFCVGLWIRISIFLTADKSERNIISKFLSNGTRLIKLILNNFETFVKTLFLDSILQKDTTKLSKVRWFMHFNIGVGFILFLIMDLVGTYTDLFHVELKGKALIVYDFLFELFGFMIFIGILIALSRRFLFKSEQMSTNLDDAFALTFLLIVVLSGFILEAVRLVKEPSSIGIYSFFGYFISKFMNISDNAVHTFHEHLWITHSLLSSLFIAYFPFSKFFHVFTTPLSIFLNTVSKVRE